MPIETRTYNEMRELARSLYRNYIDGADVSIGSDYDIDSRIVAAIFTGNQAQAQFLLRQIYGATAEGIYLDRHAARVGGRLLATKATGVLVITAPSGTDTLPISSAIVHTSGKAYTTTAGATIALAPWGTRFVVNGSNRYRLFVAPDLATWAANDVIEVNGETRLVQGVDTTSGAVDLWEPLSDDPEPGDTITAVRGARVLVEADANGADGNQIQGDTMTVSSPVGAIEATCRIVSMSGGADDEGDAELQSRVTAHDEQPPGSGNASHYREAAESVVDHRIGKALVYPGFRGFGTIDLIPMGIANARFPTPQMITAVNTAVDLIEPYTDDVLVLAPSMGSYTEATMSIEVETGFEPDFVDAIGYAVQAGSTTTQLDLDLDPSGLIEVGDRIMYSARFGGVWQVYEREVSSVGASFVTFADALPFTPAANPDGRNDVFSGGPLGLAIVAALEAVYDSLGPGTGGVGGGAAYERFPAPSDALDPVLRINALRCAVKAVAGVRDVTLTTVNDLTPADITPAAQTLLRQGQITVVMLEP